ncbi:MAG TPA: hypothetical protein VM658_16690 [bacterium]|nr:hypothetical protein [bacterium]
MSAPDQKPGFARIALKYKTVEDFAKAARGTFSKGRMTLKSKKDLKESERIILAVAITAPAQNVEIIGEIIQKIDANEEGASHTYGVRWLNFTERKLARLENKAKNPEPAPAEKKPEKNEAAAGPAAEVPPAKPEEPPPPIAPPVPGPAPLPKSATTAAPETAAPPEPALPPEPAAPVPRDAPPAPGPAPIPKSAKKTKAAKTTAAPKQIKPEPPPPEPPAPPEPPEPVAPAAPPEPPPPPAQQKKTEEEADEEYIISNERTENYPSFDKEPRVIIPAVPEPAAETPAAPESPGAADEEPVALNPESPETVADTSLDVQPPPSPPDESPAILESEAGPAPGEAPSPRPAGIEGKDAADFFDTAQPAKPAPAADESQPEEVSAPSRPGHSFAGPEVVTLEPDEGVDEEIVGPEEAGGDAAPESGPEPAAHVLKPFTGDELAALGAFLMKLLRLMLQPDKAYGSDSERSLKSLYEEFKTVMAGRDEILIFVRSSGAVKEYMLAGDVLAPVNLKNALPPEQFDALAIKLVDFFGAKKLAGMHFRRYLTEDAFRQFVGWLGRYNPARSNPEELTAGLIRDGVYHISPVFESDRIKEAGALDFRVDMTLSRMRGDIKRLKLLAEAMMEEDLAPVWTLRVEDAVKALPDGRLRAELMLHADMVVRGQEDITESDLLQEVVFASPVEMLAQAGEYLAGLYEELFQKKESGLVGPKVEAGLERIQRALRHVTARLTVELPEVGMRIMYGLYKKGAFTLEELPAELREQVMLEQFITFFLEDADKRIADFSAMAELKSYRIAANRYSRMVVELMRRGNVDVADKIFKTLVAHIGGKEQPFAERPRAARQAFAILAAPESLSVLVWSLKSVAKDKRDKLAAMIFAAGPAAAEPLVKMLTQEEDRSLRRLVCEVLTRQGEKVAPFLAGKIKDPESPWYLVRNLIMILGDAKSPLLLEDAPALWAHSHPRVREEWLVYETKTAGVSSEPRIVSALTDPDAVVRRRAVRILCRFPEIGKAALSGLCALVEAKPKKGPSLEEEQAVAEAAELLGKLAARKLPNGKGVEDVLIEALEADAGKGLLGRLTGSKPSLRTTAMRVAIIAALANAGSAKAKKALAALAKDKVKEVKESAQQALAKIG